MRIWFSTKESLELDPIVINDKQIDIVSHAKILGVNTSGDLQGTFILPKFVRKLGNGCFVSLS